MFEAVSLRNVLRYVKLILFLSWRGNNEEGFTLFTNDNRVTTKNIEF